MVNKNSKVILRWIAMPFVSIVCAFLAYWFVALWIKGNNYGFEVYNGMEVGSISQIILAIAAQAVFGFAFVYCGASVAPRHNKNCAIVLATVFCTLCAISYTYSLFFEGFNFLQLVHIAASMTGAIGASYKFSVKETVTVNNNTN